MSQRQFDKIARQIMTEKPNSQDARKAAVQGFRDREAAKAMAEADREFAGGESARMYEQLKQHWQTPFQAIHLGVMVSGEAFAREGSEYLIKPQPHVSRENAVEYIIHRSGGVGAVATLTFSMNGNGTVHPSASGARA